MLESLRLGSNGFDDARMESLTIAIANNSV